MGSASSMINIDVYISCPEKNKYIDLLENNLQSFNYNVLNSTLLKNSLSVISISEASKYIKTIIDKTKFILIYVSQNSLKSYSQSIELNELMDNNDFDKSKIIYLMGEGDYLPGNNKSLETYFVDKRWFPFYDDETTRDSIDKISSIVYSS